MLVGSATHPDHIDRLIPFVDLIELRLDYFDLSKKPDFPCIFTVRKKEQGGLCSLSESDRLQKIEKLLEFGPEYCDLEADTDPEFIERAARRFPRVKWIGSYHDFEETPHDLGAILEKMKNPHFAIYKMALKANSTLDMLRLMLFLKETRGELSAMSMGEYGKPSRIMAPILGSALNYTGVEEDPALHRYGLETLLETFHYRKLNRNTLVYSLIGDPIEKSPGDLFHNPRFKQNAVYLKMRLLGEEVPDFFRLARRLPFGGLSVTIPLKEAACVEMDRLEPQAQVIGAVNTVIFKNGKTIGTNTDGAGALNAIERYEKVKGKRIAILGAGGTARAIAYEARQRGSTVLIFNRTPERAQLAAIELGAAGYSLDTLPDHSYDILVNTIPPNSSGVPPLLPNTTVMDVVYAPKETPLLLTAKKTGCRCIYGEEMFVEQALLQQQEWALALTE